MSNKTLKGKSRKNYDEMSKNVELSYIFIDILSLEIHSHHDISFSLVLQAHNTFKINCFEKKNLAASKSKGLCLLGIFCSHAHNSIKSTNPSI